MLLAGRTVFSISPLSYSHLYVLVSIFPDRSELAPVGGHRNDLLWPPKDRSHIHGWIRDNSMNKKWMGVKWEICPPNYLFFISWGFYDLLWFFLPWVSINFWPCGIRVNSLASCDRRLPAELKYRTTEFGQLLAVKPTCRADATTSTQLHKQTESHTVTASANTLISCISNFLCWGQILQTSSQHAYLGSQRYSAAVCSAGMVGKHAGQWLSRTIVIHPCTEGTVSMRRECFSELMRAHISRWHWRLTQMLHVSA